MAAGDTLCVFTALNQTYQGATAALPDRRNNHPVLIFDAAVDWIADFHGVLPHHYSNGGVTVSLGWTAPAQSGTCVWAAAFERAAEGVDDMDADQFATALSASEVPQGTSGRLTYTEIVFANNAAMDNIPINALFRLRITRDADNASDTMAGNAELWTVHIYEN